MDAGIRLLPYVCLMVFTSILSGGLLPKTGYYIPWYISGSLLVTVGSALMSKLQSIPEILELEPGTVTDATF